MKKGEITWDTLGKILIILVIFVFIILAIWIFREKLYDIFGGFKSTVFNIGG